MRSTLHISLTRVLAAAFLWFGTAAFMYGQATNVSQGIAGTVQDPSGKYVAFQSADNQIVVYAERSSGETRRKDLEGTTRAGM